MSTGVFAAIEKVGADVPLDDRTDSSPTFDCPGGRKLGVKAEPSDGDAGKLQHSSRDPLLMDLSDLDDGDDMNYQDILIENEVAGSNGYGDFSMPNFVHSAYQFDAGNLTPMEATAGSATRRNTAGSSRKGRLYKLWTDEQMETAMKLVQQQNMSYHCAAQKCQVPVTSLRERLRKATQRGGQSGTGQSHSRSPKKPKVTSAAHTSGSTDEGSSFVQPAIVSTTRLNEAANFVIDQRVSIYTASQNYGVPIGQLKEHLRGVIRAQSRIPLLNSCLTDDQERTLVKWVKARRQRNSEATLTLETFQELVQSAVVINNNLNPNWLRVLAEELVDEPFFESFLSRYHLTGYMGEEKKPNDIVFAVVSSSTADVSTSTDKGEKLATSSGSPTKAKVPVSTSAAASSSSSASNDPDKLAMLVLQTGGTIDKDYPKTLRGYAFEIGPPAAQKVFQRFSDIDFQYVTVCRKDSQEISNADIAHLCTVCRDSSVQRILITHGTDTLLDTAQILASAGYKKFIVLTGAFKPHTFKDSDAEFNLGVAVGALQTFNDFGVYVAFHGRIFLWDQVYRNPESGKFLPKPKVPKKSEMFHN